MSLRIQMLEKEEKMLKDVKNFSSRMCGNKNSFGTRKMFSRMTY